MKHPSNIFLTCKGCVGMQWGEGTSIFTVWRDREARPTWGSKGVNHTPVTRPEHEKYLAYYKSHESAYRPRRGE